MKLTNQQIERIMAYGNAKKYKNTYCPLWNEHCYPNYKELFEDMNFLHFIEQKMMDEAGYSIVERKHTGKDTVSLIYENEPVDINLFKHTEGIGTSLAEAIPDSVNNYLESKERG